jgi:hypothetical protein
MKDIYILAVESSCDETSIAIVKNGKDCIALTVSTQMDTHAKYGGVVPEIASRMHTESITFVLEATLQKANMKIEDMDAIAVAYKPGLMGSLLVGLEFAKTLSYLDTTAKEGVTYKYKVCVIKSKTLSSFKSTEKIVYLCTPELISCENTSGANILAFGEVKGASGYEIYRKTLYTDWALIGSLEGAENTTYKDADIIENTEYFYTVKAVNGDSVSSFNQEGISC